MKKCNFPECRTILCCSNKEFCFLHARILKQNDIWYEKRKYYIVPATGGGKRKVTLAYVKRLKELLSIEDIIENLRYSQKEAGIR